MRIVGGKHRGRRLAGPADARIRPTGDRARQALFNILEHGKFAAGGVSPVTGARVLDAFCGSGAFGLEALSRGASHAHLIDNDRAAVRLARANAATLGEGARVDAIEADALAAPPARAPCGLAFLDPPYGSGLAARALAALAAAGWLAPCALCVVELGPRDELAPPTDFALLDERRSGAARFVFLRHGPV
ncbi:MAG: RsmD family RNA methyltransferase [Pseudomonadota bacterium]